MNRKRILVIDDEIAFLMAVKKMLRTDFLIFTAESLKGAIVLFDEQQFDMVITDIRLTGVMRDEGMDILKYVKESKPGTKVIVLTGYGDPELMRKAYAMGADLYLEKPVPVNILKNIIESQRVIG